MKGGVSSKCPCKYTKTTVFIMEGQLILLLKPQEIKNEAFKIIS
jgi:hypothetical protein